MSFLALRLRAYPNSTYHDWIIPADAASSWNVTIELCILTWYNNGYSSFAGLYFIKEFYSYRWPHLSDDCNQGADHDVVTSSGKRHKLAVSLDVLLPSLDWDDLCFESFRKGNGDISNTIRLCLVGYHG